MKFKQTYRTNKLPYTVNDIDPEVNWDTPWTGPIEKYQKLANALNEFYEGKFNFNVGIIEPLRPRAGKSGCVHMHTDNVQLIFRSGQIDLRIRDSKITSSKWKKTDWRIETCLPGGRTIVG